VIENVLASVFTSIDTIASASTIENTIMGTPTKCVAMCAVAMVGGVLREEYFEAHRSALG
jgi:hypothetical protein